MQKKILHLLAIVSLMVSGGVSVAEKVYAADPVSCSSSSEVSTSTQFETDFLTLINNYRVQNGLGTLKVSKSLTCAARWMSQDMINKNYFAHTEPGGRLFWQRLIAFGYTSNAAMGENIAGGYPDAQRTFDQFRNSPGHNTNMLNAQWKVIGIGRAVGGYYSYYWTTDFGGVETTGDIVGEVSPPKDITAPTVSLNGSDQTVAAGVTVNLPFTASDEVGGSGLAKVDVYQDGVVMTSYTSGNTYNFNSRKAGRFELFARAKDNAGNTSDSGKIYITVTSGGRRDVPSRGTR